MHGADFLGNWRKEMRLKELLLMGCGGCNAVCPRADPSFHPESLAGAGGREGGGALAGLPSD